MNLPDIFVKNLKFYTQYIVRKVYDRQNSKMKYIIRNKETFDNKNLRSIGLH